MESEMLKLLGDDDWKKLVINILIKEIKTIRDIVTDNVTDERKQLPKLNIL